MVFYYGKLLRVRAQNFVTRNPLHLVKQRSSDSWYVRRTVPQDIVKEIDKREVWRSLRTADKRLAERKARARERRDLRSVLRGLRGLCKPRHRIPPAASKLSTVGDKQKALKNGFGRA